MGGRRPLGDPHHGLRGKVLFRITAWLDDDLQIEEAAICSRFVLQSHTNHHDSQRGNPLRMVYRDNKVGNSVIKSVTSFFSPECISKRQQRSHQTSQSNGRWW